MEQRRMLWYSAPTSLNNDLLSDGVILEKYNKTVNMAISTSFTFQFWSGHTPRSPFLGAQRLTMEQCMQEWVERLEWEMLGWVNGRRPDPRPEIEEDGQDIEPENF